MSYRHLSVDISGALRRPQDFKGCITTDEGKILTTKAEIVAFFKEQLAMGRQFLPCGECDNFDYTKGCLGHEEKPAAESAGGLTTSTEKRLETQRMLSVADANRRIEELCAKYNISYGKESAGGFGAELARIFDDVAECEQEQQPAPREWAYSFDGERYYTADDDISESEIPEYAQTLMKDNGEDRVWIGEPAYVTIDEFVGDYGENLIYALAENAYDIVGECAEDWLDDVTREEENDLDKMLADVTKKWLKKHKREPKFYIVTAVREYAREGAE